MPQIPTEFLNQLSIVLEAIVALMTATLVAFWVGMAIWTLKDIRSRTRDFFAWLLATLLVLITGPVGILLYMLLRPRETLAEIYDRQLEEEALLRDIQVRRACPSCQSVTEPDWLLCPHCRAELRRSCQSCHRPLDLDWVLCPYCASEVAVKSVKAVKPARSTAPYQAPARTPQAVPANGMELESDEPMDDAPQTQYGETSY